MLVDSCMLKELKLELAKAIASAAQVNEEQALASLELPKGEFGDLASKVAFILAAEKKTNPVQIANEIANQLNNKKLKFIQRIETKGPYLNFYFNNGFYAEALKKILKEKQKFGTAKKKTGKQIMVEFFHANTHKGVHIGHIRNVSTGEALCKLLEITGNKIIRANFQGDIGPHVAKCLWGFLNLYNGKAPTSNRGIWLGKVYSEASKKIKEEKEKGNDELEKQVQEINLKLYAKDKKMNELWKKTRQWCLDDFKEFYKEFNVKFDELYFESQTEKVGTEVVKNALKRGIAKEDQGAIIMDLRDDNLGVYVLLTKEGYPLYSTKDLGLAKLKFDKYDLDRSIHVVGKEQEHHFKQLFKTFEKIGMEKAAKISHHLIYELVMLPEGKMSSREGTMVLYEDLKQKLLEITRSEIKKRHETWSEKEIEKIAMQITLAAIRFSMLRRENNKVLVFDWDQALSTEGDSGPYLQYAFVRTLGILSKTKEKATAEKSYAFNLDEKRLIKKLCEFSQLVEKAAHDLAPNYLTDYLLDVATDFNKFYTVSPVLTAEKENERRSRLAIVSASNILLKSGLGLLGIECPERM